MLASLDYIPAKADLKPLKGVEVFARGRWNGIDFDAADLARIVSAFEPTAREVHPVIVTNHGEDVDAGVNRGFVTGIWLNMEPGVDYLGVPYQPGERMTADLLVDPDLYDDIEQGRYLRPSIELWPEYESKADGTVYPWVLTAISYQGGKHIEAVRSLRPAALDMADQFKPLHFAHGGRAVVFACQPKTKEITKMADQPGQQAPADPMQALQAMMGQLLEFMKTMSQGQQALAAQVGELLKREVSEPAEQPEQPKDAATPEGDAQPEEPKPAPMAEGEVLEADKKKPVTMAALQRRMLETERQLFAERKARQDEAALREAQAFVAERSSDKCLKIPVKFRDKAANLIATAPSSEYRAALKALLDGVADKALLFGDKTRLFHEESVALAEASGPVGAVEARVNKLMADGKAQLRGDAYKLVFSENPSLYTEYQAALRARA